MRRSASSPLGEVASAYGLGFSKAVMHGDNGPSRELRSASGFGHGGATGTYLLVEPEMDLVIVFLFRHPMMTMLAQTPAFLSPRVSGLGRVVQHAREDSAPASRTGRRAKEA